MNALLITLATILALCSSVCDAYYQRPAYSDTPSSNPYIGAILYQFEPAATVHIIQPTSSGYGGGAFRSPYGLPAPSYRLSRPIGYDSEIISLANLALNIPTPPAVVDPNSVGLPSQVYGPSAYLRPAPAPIRGDYKIPVSSPPQYAGGSALDDSYVSAYPAPASSGLPPIPVGGSYKIRIPPSQAARSYAANALRNFYTSASSVPARGSSYVSPPRPVVPPVPASGDYKIPISSSQAARASAVADSAANKLRGLYTSSVSAPGSAYLSAAPRPVNFPALGYY